MTSSSWLIVLTVLMVVAVLGLVALLVVDYAQTTNHPRSTLAPFL